MSLVHHLRGAAAHSRASLRNPVARDSVVARRRRSRATLPSGFAETRIATGLASPTAMAFAPDGRLFVCEQSGRLRVIKNGALLATPFLTVSVELKRRARSAGRRLRSELREQRLTCTSTTRLPSSPIHNRVSRFTASASNPDVVAAGSEVQLLNLPSLSSATNHNGGAIHFGTDGKLYIAVGDNANSANSQSLTTTLGKILRINADGSIPVRQSVCKSDNGHQPGDLGARSAQSFQLRHRPHQRSHPSQRCRPELVGGSEPRDCRRELRLAADRGPRIRPASAGVRYPVYAYQNVGSNCAITGAAFYRPTTANFPAEYAGRYFFGDFCGGFIRMLSPPSYTSSTGFATGISSLVDIQVAIRTVRCTTWRAAAAKCFGCGTPRTRRRASRRIRRTGRCPRASRRASPSPPRARRRCAINGNATARTSRCHVCDVHAAVHDCPLTMARRSAPS